MFKALPPPTNIELILYGEKQLKRQGNYTLVQELFNGFPYWVHQNGEQAIWFGPTSYPSWIVGPETNLGNYGYIFGPYGVDVWPTQILDGFFYYRSSSWQYLPSSDLILKDCKG